LVAARPTPPTAPALATWAWEPALVLVRLPEFHIAMRSSHHSFSTKAKARNKVVFMEKITPHGAVEEQC
jgi:hypothetical protein